MAGLGDVFATDYEAVKGGKTKISKAILGRANDIFSSGLLEDKAKQINAGLRESMGMNNTDALYAMRNLDAMAGGDLKQNRQINEDQLNRKGVEMALNFNPAAVGQTVWHGSPHKFDKFDMSKIGTGEGAQAYGNGLYMAESPDVALQYAGKLGNNHIKSWEEVTKTIPGRVRNGAEDSILTDASLYGDGFKNTYKNIDDVVSDIRGRANKFTGEKVNAFHDVSDENLKKIINDVRSSSKSALYKVDIPDEAVTKMLDWDKPLSQQHLDVQKSLSKYGIPDKSMTGQEINSYLKEVAADRSGQTGTTPSFYKGFGPDASRLMNESGIPGIRYLDGGSRGQQAGTSNFVLFDDQMPRILEVNGQATGAQPWRPDEYKSALANAFGGK